MKTLLVHVLHGFLYIFVPLGVAFILAYFIYFSRRSPTSLPRNDGLQVVCLSTENCDQESKTTSTQTATISSWQKFVDQSFGFSLLYPPYLSLSAGLSKGVIRLEYIQNPGEVFTITEQSGPQVTDSNGHFGTVLYYYNGDQWIKGGSMNERDGSSIPPSPIDPLGYTSGGLPIFNGAVTSHGWGVFSYIVALSTTKFLIVEGQDTATSPLLQIVQSIAE